jgi:hypothetical protein
VRGCYSRCRRRRCDTSYCRITQETYSGDIQKQTQGGFLRYSSAKQGLSLLVFDNRRVKLMAAVMALARFLQSVTRRKWYPRLSSIVVHLCGIRSPCLLDSKKCCGMPPGRHTTIAERHLSLGPPFRPVGSEIVVFIRSARRSVVWSPRSQPQHWTGRVTPSAAIIHIAALDYCCADLGCYPSDAQLALAATARRSRRFCLARDGRNQGSCR